MRFRMKIGRVLIQGGRFVQSLALMIMKPDDLVEFSRSSYTTAPSIQAWSREDLVDLGLQPAESQLLEQLPLRSGKMALLGGGGGREAVAMLKAGFQVTCVDFIPDMVDACRDNVHRRGFDAQGFVQEISRLDLPAQSFDAVWFSAAMYSVIPTRKRRIAMLHRIRQVLKPGGYLVCQFYWNPALEVSPWAERLRRVFAWTTLGYMGYEKGDSLWANREFVHMFSSESDLREEFQEGAFDVFFISLDEKTTRCGAILTAK